MANIETNVAYEFGPFRLNPAERQFLRNGVSVAIPPKAFEILVLLVNNSGRLCKKQDLMEAVWPNIFVEENNLAQLVSLLRKVLGTNENDDSFIETVPKLGYRFVGEVRKLISNSQPNITAFVPDDERITVVSPEEKAAPQEILPAMVPPEGFPANPTASPIAIAIPQSGFARFSKRRIIYLLAGVLCLGIAMLLMAFLRPPAPLRALGIQPLLVNAELGWSDYIDTDRDHLYLLVSSQGRSQLAEMSNTGGEPLLLPEFPSRFLPLGLAPDGHRLLAIAPKDGIAEQGLWIVPLPAGSPWKVGNLKAHAAGWSPDGASIVFAYEKGLYTAKDDGSSQRELASLPGPAENPCWSPDGKWIRFMMQTGFESYSLLEVAAEGNNQKAQPLFADPGLTVADGHWADGNYFVFSMSRNGVLNLWALPKSSAFFHPTGANLIQLTYGQLDLFSLVPSRDGKRIFAIGTNRRYEIVRYDPSSNSFVRFWQDDVSADSLAFSPDGQQVVYSRFPDRTLWRSHIDGSQRLQLTFSPLETLLPQWSPDSKIIAFTAHTPGTPWKIYTIPVEGGQPRPLLIESKEQQATPTWSPDGNKLCFAGAPWTTSFLESSTAVHCLELSKDQLSKDSILPESKDLWSPRWSPDGRYIVAETVDSKELKLFDDRAKQWRFLVSAPDAIEYTAWSKDSRFVYFNVYGEKSSGIYRAAVDGKGAAELVLNPKNLSNAETLGQWFTLGTEGSLLLVRDTSIRGIYVVDLQYP